MSINCIIIDDEPSSQLVLKAFIADVNELNLIATCNNALEALTVLNRNTTIDLLFLDINMPKITGLEFYKSLQNPPKVIFTTAYSQYAVDGFEVNAVDYLLKPFSFNRFLKAIQKVVIAEPKPNSLDSIIFIKSNKVLHRIKTKEIEYIEAFGDYVKIHLYDKTITTNSTFSKILKDLPNTIERCHKSFAVNISKINSVTGNIIYINEKTIPIGQKFKTDFIKMLN